MLGFWLLHDDVLRRLIDAHKGASISAEQQRAFIEREEAARAERGPRSLTLAGDVAEIRVEGVLTKRPDIWAWIFGMGNTSYADLIEAIGAAQSKPEIKSVRVVVDSPGGDADGLFDVFAALEQLKTTKRVEVHAANAYSAAYGIAAVAGPITATTPASMFGSVGVAVRYVRWSDMELYDLTNTESPDKRPDPAKPEGQAVIRRELDAFFDLFAEAIAKGRSTSTGESVTRNDVAENFGRGASFTAKEAKRRGMIDTVPKATARPSLRVVSNENEDHASPVEGQEGCSMGENRLTLEQLRAQHPELHNEVFNSGRDAGVAQERDRVVAHLTMGEASGDMPTASAAIRNGDVMTATLQATYLAAGMNRADRKTRQQESDAVGAVVDGVATDPASQATPSFGEQVVAILEQRRGKKD